MAGLGRKQTCQPVQLWGASHKSSLEPDAKIGTAFRTILDQTAGRKYLLLHG